MFFAVRSNDSFNFPLGLIKYIVIVICVHDLVIWRSQVLYTSFPAPSDLELSTATTEASISVHDLVIWRSRVL